MVISTSSGRSSAWNVRGVPHRGQNLRVACSDDRKVVGSPDENLNPAEGTVTQATSGAPLIRRHMEQWQLVSFDTGPSAS